MCRTILRGGWVREGLKKRGLRKGPVFPRQTVSERQILENDPKRSVASTRLAFFPRASPASWRALRSSASASNLLRPLHVAAHSWPNGRSIKTSQRGPMTLFNRAGATFAGFVLVLCAWSLGAQPLPVAKPEQVGMSAQRLAKIGEALKKEAADGSFRGAVVMVARKGKLVYQEAVGMQTASAKMTPEAIFRIYSMTKPLVSVAAMMLVEDGVGQLTDPVSKYLSGFDKLQVSGPTKDAAGNTTYTLVPQERQMTVQDLLRHTSGLAYGEITQNAPVKEGLERIGVYRQDMDYEARNLPPGEAIEKMG